MTPFQLVFSTHPHGIYFQPHFPRFHLFPFTFSPSPSLFLSPPYEDGQRGNRGWTTAFGAELCFFSESSSVKIVKVATEDGLNPKPPPFGGGGGGGGGGRPGRSWGGARMPSCWMTVPKGSTCPASPIWVRWEVVAQYIQASIKITWRTP